MRNETISVRERSIVVQAHQPEYRTVDLARYLRAIIRRKKLILIFALAGLALGGILAFIIGPRYDATVRFLPPEQKDTMSALMPMSGLLGGGKGQGDHYLALVKSEAVADDVIEHQHLMQYFKVKKLSDARRQLTSISKIETDKDQMVSVRVRAKEPQTAMNIANEYLAALYRLSNELAISEAQHHWEFYEIPLEQEKNRLAQAEEELKVAQQKTGVVLPEAEARAGVTTIAEIKGQIASREEQLAGLRAGGTEQNPRVIQLKSQIAGLYEQIDLLQKQTGGHGVNGNPDQLPALAMEVERKAREVKFHETLFGILSKQYENARVDQSYTPNIELVDRATFPDEKSFPPRKIFMLGGLLFGALVGVCYVCLKAAELSRRLTEFLAETEYEETPRLHAADS
jgi:tyrosine-protein kinase Etk/Wzc